MQNKPLIKAAFLALLAICLIIAIWSGQKTHAPTPDISPPYVTRVIDGDTIELANGEKVRLIGLDTPETLHPEKPVEYYGEEASEFTKRMVEGKRIRLEYDVQQRDRYGRLLAYVYLEDGTFLNAELLRQGYANLATHPPNVKHVEQFVQLQREARENHRGRWAAGGPESFEMTAPPRGSPSQSRIPNPFAEGKYVGSSQSNIYHYPDCYWALKIYPQNLIHFQSAKEAQEKGYRPCKVCKPPARD